jgi:hypothetical protein
MSHKVFAGKGKIGSTWIDNERNFDGINGED